MVEQLRVLFVFAELDRGGAETMCMNLYRALDRSLIQFDFVKHTQKKGAYEDEITALGGRIFVAPQYKGVNHLAYQRWWAKHLKNHPEHSVVHGHYITAASVYLAVAKKKHRVTIAHSHSSQPRGNFFERQIKSIYIKRAKAYSDYCLACSEEAGEWVFCGREYQIIHNAIDAARFVYNPQIRNEVRLALEFSEYFVLGTVGSLSTVKNPFGLLDIFEKVYKDNPNARLLWVGSGPLYSDIEKELIKRDLKDKVVMTGARGDIERLLQAMDVFLFPSLWEGLGMAAIEAQASGLPVFCSDCVPQAVNISGLCCFLPLDRPDLWSKAVSSVDYERKDNRKQIIEAGYGICETANIMERFYFQIVRD